jgi:hypothetical protein
LQDYLIAIIQLLLALSASLAALDRPRAIDHHDAYL